MSDAMVLVTALRDPASTVVLDAEGWTALLTIARAERLIGTLAYRLEGQAMPDAVAAILADERTNADYQKRSALWEADCAERALAAYPGKVVLMKGTAYAAAGLQAAEGRHIGDLDMMVARQDLPQVEAMLLAAGWEWVKEDAYDDAYYRDHMHELPPLIHKERDRIIDVHHTILPLTARPKPDAKAMLADAIPLKIKPSVEIEPFVSSPSTARRAGAQDKLQPSAEDETPIRRVRTDGPLVLAYGQVYPERLQASRRARGERKYAFRVFSPTDMIIHSAAHLFADGDLDGGLRNLWDIHCLVTEFADEEEDFFLTLTEDAWHHGLAKPVNRALRLSRKLYGTKLVAYNEPIKVEYGFDWTDRYYIARLKARNEWGQQIRKHILLIFYIRSHLLRMPPLMLMRHLWTKWRKQNK